MAKKIEKWELLESKKIFDNRWSPICENKYKMANGTILKGFYHLVKGDYVTILAHDQDNKILLAKSYRRGVDEILYELPAGHIDKGESPDEAAVRELKEEAGYEGEVLEVCKQYPIPAFSEMTAYLVLMKFDSTNKGAVELAEDEEFEHFLVSARELKQMFKKGDLFEMNLLAALNYLDSD